MDDDFGESTNSFPMEKHILIRVVVMTVSFLTMVGSVIVVLSYVCVKSFRSEGRQIVLNLSLMDLGIGLANFTGAAINFDKYYSPRYNSVSGTVDALCKAQAFVALLTTFSSVFWTMSLAIYMYILVFHNFQRSTIFYLPLCYFACYGLPLALTLWLFFTNRLGNAPYNSSGWCGVILIKPDDNSIDVFAAVLGYDLWIYLTFFLCATIYCALFLRINVEFKSAAQLIGVTRFWSQALQFLDFKLVLIPMAFFLLRIWSCIVNILFVYCGIDPSSLHHSANLALIILAGIGDSGQGLANGLIFVLFVKKVRQRLFSLRWKRKHFLWNKNRLDEDTPLLINTDILSIPSNDKMFTPTNSLIQ